MKARAFSLMAIFAAIYPLGSVFGSEENANQIPPTVIIRGIRIAAEPYKNDDMLRPFNQTGTAISIEIVYPPGGLIEMDEEESELKRLIDDRDTDLLASKGRFQRPGFGSFPKLSDDTRAAVIEISSPGRPASGAKSITTSGTLVFKAATTKKTFKQENVTLSVGESIEAGPIKFKINAVSKPDWGDEPLQVTLETNRDISELAEIRFTNDAGELIKSRQASSSRMGGLGMVRIKHDYALAEKVDKVTIEMDYWTDMHDVVVPFELSTSVGF